MFKLYFYIHLKILNLINEKKGGKDFYKLAKTSLSKYDPP